MGQKTRTACLFWAQLVCAPLVGRAVGVAVTFNGFQEANIAAVAL